MKVRRPLSFYLFMLVFLGGSLANFWWFDTWLWALSADLTAYVLIGSGFNKIGGFKCWRLVIWWLPLLLLPGLNWLKILRLGEVHGTRKTGS